MQDYRKLKVWPRVHLMPLARHKENNEYPTRNSENNGFPGSNSAAIVA
jgi:hypothetical protein